MKRALFQYAASGVISCLLLSPLAATANDHPSADPAICATPQPGLPVNEGEQQNSASRAIDLIPDGWVLVDKIDGHLDYDSKPDAVLIIRRNDPARHFHTTAKLASGRYDCNRRAMLVTVKDDTDHYRVVAANDTLIPDWSDPKLGDPYEGLSIARRALHLYINFWPTEESPSNHSRVFRFRWSGEVMHLIGFDQTNIDQGTGEIKRTSVNFLTNKRNDMVGLVTDTAPNWVLSDVPEEPLVELSAVGDGFAFEPK